MPPWWRRVRGALGLGAIWGSAAGLFGIVGGALAGLFGGLPMLIAGFSGVAMGTIGFMLGAGFGSVLTLLHGDRTLDELSIKRAAGLGFLAGAGLTLGLNVVGWLVVGSAVPLSVVVPALVAGSISYGVVTAVLASGTVAVARRAPDPPVISDWRAREGISSGRP